MIPDGPHPMPSRSVFGAVADTICALCTLPAVPTHDWAMGAARAIAGLSGNGRACVMLVRDGDEGRVQIEAVGVASGAPESGQDNGGQGQLDMSVRVRAERLSSFGIPLTPKMRSAGVVARCDSLYSSWRETPLGRVWAGVGAGDPLIAIVPIQSVDGNVSGGVGGGEERAVVKGVRVVCMFTGDESGAAIPVEAFGAVISVLCARVEAMVSSMNYEKQESAEGGFRWLTVREQEVLDALIEGHSVREIADRLDRSKHTVHDHVKSLHKKLHASNRGQLVAAALGHISREGQCPPRPAPMILGEHEPITELKPAPGAAQRPLG